MHVMDSPWYVLAIPVAYTFSWDNLGEEEVVGFIKEGMGIVLCWREKSGSEGYVEDSEWCWKEDPPPRIVITATYSTALKFISFPSLSFLGGWQYWYRLPPLCFSHYSGDHIIPVIVNGIYGGLPTWTMSSKVSMILLPSLPFSRSHNMIIDYSCAGSVRTGRGSICILWLMITHPKPQ